MLKLLFKVLLSTLIGYYSLFSTASASINGIWKDSQGQYWIYLEERGSVISVKIKATLSDPEIYLGSLSNSNLQANALLTEASLKVNVSTTEDVMQGVLTQLNEEFSYEATKFLTYLGSDFDGIWTVGSNHYLFYMSVNSEGNPLIVVVDILINNDKTINHDIFVGSFNKGTFEGVSLITKTRSMNLIFAEDSISLEGRYIVRTIPKEITEFTGSRIFLVNPTNLDLETLNADFDQQQVLVFIKSALLNESFNIMQSESAKLATSMVSSLSDEQKTVIIESLKVGSQTTSAQKAKCSDLNYPDFWEWANLCK